MYACAYLVLGTKPNLKTRCRCEAQSWAGGGLNAIPLGAAGPFMQGGRPRRLARPSHGRLSAQLHAEVVAADGDDFLVDYEITDYGFSSSLLSASSNTLTIFYCTQNDSGMSFQPI